MCTIGADDGGGGAEEERDDAAGEGEEDDDVESQVGDGVVVRVAILEECDLGLLALVYSI